MNPIPVKTALNLLGKEVGELKMPHASWSGDGAKGCKNLEKLAKAKKEGDRKPAFGCACVRKNGRIQMVKDHHARLQRPYGSGDYKALQKKTKAQIVAGIDIADSREKQLSGIYKSEDCDVEADVIIDFSSAKAVDGLSYSEKRQIPVVLCTTGLTEGAACKSGRNLQKGSSSEICEHVPWDQHC